MKLRKQTPAKALIVAGTAALMVAFYSIIRAEPRTGAAADETRPPSVDYQRFFAPAATSGSNPSSPPAIPHGRSRAS